MCLEIYELDPTCFLTAPGLTWKAALILIKIKNFHILNTGM